MGKFLPHQQNREKKTPKKESDFHPHFLLSSAIAAVSFLKNSLFYRKFGSTFFTSRFLRHSFPCIFHVFSRILTYFPFFFLAKLLICEIALHSSNTWGVHFWGKRKFGKFFRKSRLLGIRGENEEISSEFGEFCKF